MICCGIDALSGAGVEVGGDGAISTVRPAARTALHIAPGWIDLQVNGFAGVDYNAPEAPLEEIARSIRVLYSTGVTRFFPTVITGSPERMRGALATLARARETFAEGAAIEGFHIEGPHISPEDGPRGAHPRQWVRKPDFDEFRSWQDASGGLVRLVTIAPEWPEAPQYIEKIVGAGVTAAIGHTAAGAREIEEAVRAGATLSTHLGNGAHPMIRRHPNYIWDQLAEDRLMADFIADGIHLPAAFLKTAIRAKGVERSVLITDAVMPAACSPGRYRLGELEVDLTPRNQVLLKGTDRLAGSALRMDRGVENLMRLAGLSLAHAVRMATVNAARAGRIAHRAAGLAPGDRSDIVLFAFDETERSIRVHETWVSGERVYRTA